MLSSAASFSCEVAASLFSLKSLSGRIQPLSLTASHSSLLFLSASLAAALPQPLGQGGANSTPMMWRGKESGGHLPLQSVSAEAKSQ